MLRTASLYVTSPGYTPCSTSRPVDVAGFVTVAHVPCKGGAVVPQPDELRGAGGSACCMVAAAGVEERGWHAEQGALPVVSLKERVSQGLHWPPSGPEYPTSHRQCATSELALGDTLKAGQGAQGDEPAADL